MTSELIREGKNPHVCLHHLPMATDTHHEMNELRKCECGRYFLLGLRYLDYGLSRRSWLLSDEHGCTEYHTVRVSGRWYWKPKYKTFWKCEVDPTRREEVRF